MAGHKYRVEVTPLDDDGRVIETCEPIRFDTTNHDDITVIVSRIMERPDLDFTEEECKSFAVGLKLFSEVLIKHRKDPVFAPLKESFPEFMKNLKRTGK